MKIRFLLIFFSLAIFFGSISHSVVAMKPDDENGGDKAKKLLKSGLISNEEKRKKEMDRLRHESFVREKDELWRRQFFGPSYQDSPNLLMEDYSHFSIPHKLQKEWEEKWQKRMAEIDQSLKIDLKSFVEEWEVDPEHHLFIKLDDSMLIPIPQNNPNPLNTPEDEAE